MKPEDFKDGCPKCQGDNWNLDISTPIGAVSAGGCMRERYHTGVTDSEFKCHDCGYVFADRQYNPALDGRKEATRKAIEKGSPMLLRYE